MWRQTCSTGRLRRALSRFANVTTEVERTSVRHGSDGSRPTLEQRFELRGPHVDRAMVSDVLMTAPMLGARSIFGERPGTEGAGSDGSRHLRGFSPVRGFVFDVDLRRIDEGFVVRLSQPGRRKPYLHGDMLWIVDDTPGGAVLDEQINTGRALQVVDEPLGGAPRSLRRRLFFRVGHKQVMLGATRNIGALIDARSS